MFSNIFTKYQKKSNKEFMKEKWIYCLVGFIAIFLIRNRYIQVEPVQSIIAPQANVYYESLFFLIDEWRCSSPFSPHHLFTYPTHKVLIWVSVKILGIYDHFSLNYKTKNIHSSHYMWVTFADGKLQR